MRALFFVALVIIPLCGLGYYLRRRVLQTFALPRWAGLAITCALAFSFVMAVLLRVLGGGPIASTLGLITSIVCVGLIVTSVLLAPYELVRFVVRRFGKPKASVPAAEESGEAPAQPARRDFLEQAAVGSALAVGFGSVAYGGLFGRHDYALETVAIKLDKLPRALDGFSIVQLSDIHTGMFVGEAEFRAGLELVKKARPDIVVLTGDLIDHDVRQVPRLAAFVHRLRSVARRGVFAIPGNHDYYAGANEVLRALDEAGAEVLLNRHVRIGDAASFILAGVDDVMASGFGGKGPDLNAAFRNAPDELARVLLAHNPAFYAQAHQQADLVLSGHTHGGQITLFINPAELVLRHGYVRGHYLREQSQLYVNRGFGTAGPPVRVGSPPEVTRIVLTS